jgi:hypothetical protein
MKSYISREQIVKLYADHAYPVEDGINVFGIRNIHGVVDQFDDILGIFNKDVFMAFSGTTEPGKSWLIKGGNINGTFILQPGFYKSCWHKGKHHGEYDALVQFGSGVFKGWRDNNKDGVLDEIGKTWNDVIGLNFHTTRWDKQVQRVGDFSAGCMVIYDAHEFDQIMKVVYASTQSLFSYALFEA